MEKSNSKLDLFLELDGLINLIDESYNLLLINQQLFYRDFEKILSKSELIVKKYDLKTKFSIVEIKSKILFTKKGIFLNGVDEKGPKSKEKLRVYALSYLRLVTEIKEVLTPLSLELKKYEEIIKIIFLIGVSSKLVDPGKITDINTLWLKLNEIEGFEREFIEIISKFTISDRLRLLQKSLIELNEE